MSYKIGARFFPALFPALVTAGISGRAAVGDVPRGRLRRRHGCAHQPWPRSALSCPGARRRGKGRPKGIAGCAETRAAPGVLPVPLGQTRVSPLHGGVQLHRRIEAGREPAPGSEAEHAGRGRRRDGPDLPGPGDRPDGSSVGFRGVPEADKRVRSQCERELMVASTSQVFRAELSTGTACLEPAFDHASPSSRETGTNASARSNSFRRFHSP